MVENKNYDTEAILEMNILDMTTKIRRATEEKALAVAELKKLRKISSSNDKANLEEKR